MNFLKKLFNSGDEEGRFRAAEEYAEQRASQLRMTPQTLEALRDCGVGDSTNLRLEYFFYTDTEAKAQALTQALEELGYAGAFHDSEHDPDLLVVTGWTSKIRMDDATVIDWVGRMCDLGQSHDCEFDGWGTNPQQP